MTEIMEIFAPTMKFWREQQELEKMLVISEANAGGGPLPLDLDSGIVELRDVTHRDSSETDSH
jgi:hypothetical protein